MLQLPLLQISPNYSDQSESKIPHVTSNTIRCNYYRPNQEVEGDGSSLLGKVMFQYSAVQLQPPTLTAREAKDCGKSDWCVHRDIHITYTSKGYTVLAYKAVLCVHNRNIFLSGADWRKLRPTHPATNSRSFISHLFRTLVSVLILCNSVVAYVSSTKVNPKYSFSFRLKWDETKSRSSRDNSFGYR